MPWKCLAVDGGFEIVRVIERLGDGDGGIGGEFDFQRAAAHQLGEILAIDIFHGDEEEAFEVAVFVDAHHARIDGGERACSSAPRRSASMASRVSESALCSISLSATSRLASVSCAR